MTRLGENLPLGQKNEVFGNFSRIYLVFGRILDQRWKFIVAIGHIFITIKGQILGK